MPKNKPSPTVEGGSNAGRRPARALRMATWLSRWRPYPADDPGAAGFRARQLQALLNLTPVAMAINIVNACVINIVTWSQVPHAFLVVWGAAIVGLAALGWRGWLRNHARTRATASVRAMRHAVLQASVLASLWALLPLTQFARLDANARFFVGTIMTGMICAGGFALSTVPAAATAWVALLGTGSVVALWRSDMSVAAGVATMLSLYCFIVIFSAWSWARNFGARLVAEARADRQHEVIGLLLRDFENHASDLLWELDARGKFRHVSPRLASTLGVSSSILSGLHAWRVLRRAGAVGGDDAAARWRALHRQLVRGTAVREHVVAFAGPDGPSWWSLSAHQLLDAKGRVDGWRGVAANVTDKHLAHLRLTWLAHNDALTGLVNRSQFRELLAALLASTPVLPLTVVLIDLDDFKQVNDNHGHAAGDELLRVIGERLLAVARRSDTAARLGGDEFALMARAATAPTELAALLERLLKALTAPCEVSGRAMAPRVSIGVAIAPADGVNVDTVLNHADVALYAAKNAGGQRWRIFEPAMAEAGRRRSTLAAALRHAVARGEFSLAFQPQVNSGDGQVCGFEALLRWHSDEHGHVPPNEFVPIAEDVGLMPEIGAWVLAEACRQAALWPSALRVSINVSVTQLQGKQKFIDCVELAARGLRPETVELEITESALIDDVDEALATLHALHAKGFRIALDDFGTGYSALGYLRRFPFSTLKIDRSFVTEIAKGGESLVLVETIVAMAHALHMTTVAEGVEQAEEAEILRTLGCDMLQGYLVSRPMAAGQMANFLNQWQTASRAEERKTTQPSPATNLDVDGQPTEAGRVASGWYGRLMPDALTPAPAPAS